MTISRAGFYDTGLPCNWGSPLPEIRCLRSLDHSLIAKELKQELESFSPFWLLFLLSLFSVWLLGPDEVRLEELMSGLLIH